MSVTQSSLDSYLILQKEGKLGANQTIVYDVFKTQEPQELSIFDLSQLLGWSENRITGRLMELRKKGKIIEGTGKWQSQTQRQVKTWRVKHSLQDNNLYKDETTRVVFKHD